MFEKGNQKQYLDTGKELGLALALAKALALALAKENTARIEGFSTQNYCLLLVVVR